MTGIDPAPFTSSSRRAGSAPRSSTATRSARSPRRPPSRCSTRSAPRRARRMLDVASGPGFIAAAAADRGAIGGRPRLLRGDGRARRGGGIRRIDVSRRRRRGAARSTPPASTPSSMNFGLLHLARPDAALAEAHRVLRPGGRYAFTVWAAPERAVAFGMALRAIEQFGNANVPLPEGPPFFRFSDAAETARTLDVASASPTSTVRELPLDVAARVSRRGVRRDVARRRAHRCRPARADAARRSPRSADVRGSRPTRSRRLRSRCRRCCVCDEIPMPASARRSSDRRRHCMKSHITPASREPRALGCVDPGGVEHRRRCPRRAPARAGRRCVRHVAARATTCGSAATSSGV